MVVILNANALAIAATGTWHSIATGSNLTYTASSATGIAAQDVNGKAMTIVYLENLGFQKIGQNSNVDDVAWLRNEGYPTKKSKIFGNRSLILYLCGEKSI